MPILYYSASSFLLLQPNSSDKTNSLCYLFGGVKVSIPNCVLMFLFWQIMRDPETGNSRGFGFISYDSFEASDAAIEVLFSFFCSLACYSSWMLLKDMGI